MGVKELGIIGNFVPIILVCVVFYLLLIRPQMKEQQRRKAQIAALKKGDRIITTGGIHGTVATVEEQTLMVKVSENTKIRIAKSAVAGLVDGDGAAPQQQQ